MKKRQPPVMTPDQVESLGRMTPADFSTAKDITRLLEEAEKRMSTRPQRSEDGAQGAWPPPS